MPVTRYLLEHAMNSPYGSTDDWMNELIDIAMQGGPPSGSGTYSTPLSASGLTPTEASLSLGANSRDMVLQALAEQPLIAARDEAEAKAETERQEKLEDANTAYQRGLEATAFETQLKAVTAAPKNLQGQEIPRTPQQMTEMQTAVDQLLAKYHGGAPGAATATNLNTGGYQGSPSGSVTIGGKTKVFDPITGQWVDKGAVKPPPPTKPKKPPIEAPAHAGTLSDISQGLLPEGSVGRSLMNVFTTDQPSDTQKGVLNAIVGGVMPGARAVGLLTKKPEDIGWRDVVGVLTGRRPTEPSKTAVAPNATPAAPEPTGTPQAPPKPTAPFQPVGYDPHYEPYQWLQEQLKTKDPARLMQEINSSPLDEGDKRVLLQFLRPHLTGPAGI